MMTIYILKNRGYKINLNIYSALYSDDYNWYYNEIYNLINKLNLEEFVIIHNEYMQDHETLDNLSSHDCLVFPYQFTNESSSAAVRQGLASLAPVLVTPHPIFDDISGLVNKLDGFTPEDIANGIQDFYCKKMNSIDSLSYKQDQENKYERIKNIQFSKISQKLANMIKSLEIN